jgi:hypothetical protein
MLSDVDYFEKGDKEAGTETLLTKAEIDKIIREYNSAIENLYMDRATGVLDQDSFSGLLKAFTDKKRELSYEMRRSADRTDGIKYAYGNSLSWPEAARLLISSVEVSKKDLLSHEQEVCINWLF